MVFVEVSKTFMQALHLKSSTLTTHQLVLEAMIETTSVSSYMQKFIDALNAGDRSIPADVEGFEINRCFFASEPGLPAAWGSPTADVNRS